MSNEKWKSYFAATMYLINGKQVKIAMRTTSQQVVAMEAFMNNTRQ